MKNHNLEKMNRGLICQKEVWYMAKVELAYSLEINDIVDAIEANALWLEGILSDKRAFECVYEKNGFGLLPSSSFFFWVGLDALSPPI